MDFAPGLRAFHTELASEAVDLEEFQLRLKVSGLNLATPVYQTGRWQFSRLILFASHTLDVGAKLDCVRILCVSRLFLSPQKFGSLRGSFPRLKFSAIAASVT